MTERREFVGKDRRGRAGKVFQTAEQILKDKTETADKLRGYELDEGVPSKKLISAIVIIILVAIAGLFRENMSFLFTCLVGIVITAGIGIAMTRAAIKKARERFAKENLHLVKYLLS